MRFQTLLLLWALCCAVFCTTRDAFAAETPKQADRYDVILLVDGAPSTATLSRQSARVVTEAMGDRHRLAIVTFGEKADVLMPLSKIATVEEKTGALAALSNAPFAEEKLELPVGLNAALSLLEEGAAEGTKKVIVLLTGAPSTFKDEAEARAFKESLAPSLLSRNVLLYVVATPDANMKLLEGAASLSGGKCLAAVDVETMTDALDLIVDTLAPQKEVVVVKEVPVKTIVNQIQEMSPDEKLRRNEEAARQRTLFVTFATLIIVLLLGVLGLLYVALKRLAPEKKAARKDAANKSDKSGFAELRNLAVSLNNASVDMQEMIEQLNLDLEDFGVEKWRVEKLLEKRFADLALGAALLIDHLKLEENGGSSSEAARLCDKLERLLADAEIRKIQVEPGDAFDSVRHKAVETRPSEVNPGCVAAVLRPGFELISKEKGKESRVLRQAEVAVSPGAKQERKDA